MAFSNALRDGRNGGIVVAISAHIAFVIHQRIHRNVAALGDLIVVKVVRAGNLHRARAEIWIWIFIRDDRNQAAELFRPDWDFTQLADDRSIALIRRVHSHRAITKHGFRPRCCDRDIVPLLFQRDVAVRIFLDIGVGLTASERIFEVPHMAVDFFILDFEIGNRRLELRVPIDQTFGAIDQALIIEIDKSLVHGRAEILVQREFGILPITRGAEAFELIENGAARFLFPLPDFFNEGVAAHGTTILIAAGCQLALDDHLRGNARMVHARLPTDILAAHPLEPAQNVLDRIVERVTHVEATGDVWRRNHNRIGFGAGIHARPETARLFPALINTLLMGFRVKTLVDHRIFPVGQKNRKRRAIAGAPVSLAED